MKSTAEQLLEQLGNKSEITIMSDVVYGLDFEYRQLQREIDIIAVNNDILYDYINQICSLMDASNIEHAIEKIIELKGNKQNG